MTIIQRIAKWLGIYTPRREAELVAFWTMRPTYKAARLASIARERCLLKDKLAVAIRQKKARAPIYAALRALSNEEFRIEQGK
jgi:hypothetical protein